MAILYFVFLILVSGMRLNAQNKMLDSVYTDYIKTTNTDQKLSKTLHLVLLLGDNNDIEQANKLITNLEKLTVEPSKAEYKQGIILLSKALLYKTMDSANKSIFFSQKAIPFLSSNKSDLAEAKSLTLLNYYMQGHFDSCIQMGSRILPEIKKSGNINSELEVLMCVGRSHDFVGDRKKAIQISLSAIELAKQHQKIIKLSELYISMSTIYKGEDINVAKKYALESLAVLKKTKDERASSVVNVCYLILGNVYYDMKNKDSALYYYDLCREASLKVNDRRTYLAALGNIGNVTYEQGNYAKALEYNFLTLKEYRQIGITSEIAVAYGSLADIYKDMKNYPKAISYYDSALVITKQIQSADDFIYNYKGLSETYEMMGNDKEAFKYYRLYKQWNDSINNNQNSKKITQMELDYKYKSEQKEKDLIQKNKDLITQEKISNQKYIIWSGIIGSLLLVVFLGFTIKTNIARKKINAKLQSFNAEITRQKDVIEEKNNEITDSITYASRIQQGVIPDEQEMKMLFPQHFVFFRPRNIVSGDFYWANRVAANNHALLAVADCTGHGVPGAFMSLVGNTLLNQTLNNKVTDTPAKALDYINQQLPKTIKSKTSTGTIKDGMEIAMCEFDFDTLTMSFAGANTNIYVVRNGVIQIYKGDKQPIGENFSDKIIPYTNHVIQLQKGDCVYLITDGYADQFGGQKGKKFKYKPLEDLFSNVAGKEPEQQKEIISETFNNWKLNHEQVDDVLVVGIKV